MDTVKCFDVASTVIDEATDRFGPLFRVNEERLHIFQQYCDAIDVVSEDSDGISFDVEVDETTMEVTVLLECEEIIVETKNHVLYDLLDRTIKYGFSVSEDGNLLVKFVFPSLWCKA